MAEHESISADKVTDHKTIREWVEARGGHPACVRGTGSGKMDPGVLRIDFPGFSGEESLEQITWDAWFRQFDANDLALLVSTEKGNRFNKLVNREAEAHSKAA